MELGVEIFNVAAAALEISGVEKAFQRNQVAVHIVAHGAQLVLAEDGFIHMLKLKAHLLFGLLLIANDLILTLRTNKQIKC